MPMNKKGLGRGINALFDGGNREEIVQPDGDSLINIPISAIQPNPVQPRKIFSEDALRELAESITAHGILQPLLVRPGSIEGTWQLIAGERRLRAAKMAGLSEVPALYRELDDQEALIVTLLENLQREDLNPLEEARGLEALKNATNSTIEQLAETLGQSRSALGHSLRLLTLPAPIQKAVADGNLSPSHARALGSLPDEVALELAKRVLTHRLTTKETEESTAFWKENGKLPWSEQEPRQKPSRDPQIVRLANDIGAALKCRAKISGTSEKGRISISYDTNEQLFDLLEKLGLQLN